VANWPVKSLFFKPLAVCQLGSKKWQSGKARLLKNDNIMPDKVDILIVDDLQDKILVLESILGQLDERVITARSGAEALRHVLEREFAVILLDVNMPGMDGFETASLIRGRKKSAHTPIIFLTAFADEMHAARGYSLGAVDYILTPVVPDVLRTKVKVFVDLFRMTRQVRRQADQRVALAGEQAARVSAEESTRRSAFLAEASKALAVSLDPGAIERGLVRLVVPRLGDLGVLCLLEENNGIKPTQLAWADEAYGRGVRPFGREEQLHPGLLEAVQRVGVSGETESLAEVGKGPASTWPDSSNQACRIGSGPDFELTSAVVLPLAARSKVVGVLLLAMGPSGRQYGEADRALAEDLAGRAAIALDNARLYRDIQDSDRRKNEFLAMLAHELRNPLAPIRNACQILRLAAPDQSDLYPAVDLIDRQVQHLARLVDDLIDIGRITRSKIQLQTEPVDVAAVVQRAAEISQPLIETRRQELSVSLPAAPLWVNADPVRLAQVLGNLLNNAAKYTQEGGRVWLAAAREGEQAVFRVRDNGVGIPSDMLAGIFELFTQVDRSLDRSQGGLGIGLTLVKRLVELHGGTVKAFSAGADQGSEFVVRLPALVVPPPDPAFNTGGSTSIQAPARRVLVVDDHMDAAKSLAMLLRLHGHEVRLAHHGRTALEVAADFRPEVVFLDIGLPEMDGYEVARRLRQDMGLKDIAIAALTGYGQDEDRRRSLSAGIDVHLVKPVNLETLHKLLARPDKLKSEPAFLKQ
jgi:signal transduction histidine kinase/DNA-binding response OmpR family regulator